MSRIDKYHQFNPKAFIKDLDAMKKDKARLLKMLEETTQLSSVSNESGVRSTNIAQTTANQALKRISIKEEIEEIERFEAAHQRAMEKLSKDDVELLEGFFHPKEPIWKFRMRYAATHYIGDTLIYKHRNRALRRYGEIVDGELNKYYRQGD